MSVILQVRSQELVAVCDRCLQPVDEATFQANMERLEVHRQLSSLALAAALRCLMLLLHVLSSSYNARLPSFTPTLQLI
jgi:hypothetical protein